MRADKAAATSVESPNLIAEARAVIGADGEGDRRRHDTGGCIESMADRHNLNGGGLLLLVPPIVHRSGPARGHGHVWLEAAAGDEHSSGRVEVVELDAAGASDARHSCAPSVHDIGDESHGARQAVL